MPMFRARPRIVEALMFNGQNATVSGLPQWYVNELLAARIRLGPKVNSMDTPQGPMNLNVGDWIVRDERGLYPMRKDLFDAMYEPLPAGTEVPAPAIAPEPAPASASEPAPAGVDWPIKG